MLIKQKSLILASFILLFSFFTMVPELFARPSSRRPRRPHGRYSRYRRPETGYTVLPLPSRGISISVGGFQLHYSDQTFYRRSSYVLVAPPAGAVVYSLPPHYYPVLISGNLYYTYGGVYYRQTPRGYIAVSCPRSGVLFY